MTTKTVSAFVVLLTLACSDARDSRPVRGGSAAVALAAPAAPASLSSVSSGAPAEAGAPASLADWVRDARSGSLILRSRQDGVVLAGPSLASDVSLTITGTVARGSLRQTFRNPSDDWVEGIYVFPLPDDAAVDHLRIRTAGRVIEGRIQEREEARRTYEAAAAEGRRAGLVEQERPNVFTTRIANVPPGSEVDVEIEYQQTVRQADGAFELRVPTVVAPRFLPGGAEPGASRPTRVHPFTIEVDLAPGFDLAELASPYHPIQVSDDGIAHRVRLADGPVPADRDFVLRWRPEPGQDPGATLFTETLGGDTYALLLVTPPFSDPETEPGRPREVVFVIDTSGSMAGPSIVQARSALAFALERLGPADRFNVIQFDSATRALFESPRPADPETVAEALDYVSAMQADGGTVIAPAIRLALEDPPVSRSILRQVVFLTDGSVGNEAALLEELVDSVGEIRVFAIGIGPVPNTYFMRKLAQLGRGTFTHIGDPNEVAEKMTALFRKLETAVLTGIRVELPGAGDVEMYPYAVPDLYAGEPVAVAFKLDGSWAGASVRGVAGDGPWQVDVDPGEARERPGVHVLWARKAIGERMDDRLGARDPRLLATLRAEVVDLALAHHLVSAYTSLVAVDVTPERHRHETLEQHALGAALPSGWQADADFGFAAGATPAGLHVGIGLALLGSAWLWRRRLA